MKLSSREQKLVDTVPLMKCCNRLEFKQRLQWLSEGMLYNHLHSVIPYKISDVEIQHYLTYKEV